MVGFFENIVSATIIISTILALLIIFNYHKLSQQLKCIGIYLIIGAAIDIVSSALYFKSLNNLVFLHLFTLFEFVILSYFFNAIFKILKSKYNIKYLAIIVAALIIANTFFLQDIQSFNTYSSILSSTLIIGYCIHFFVLILDFKPPDYQFIVLKWFVYCIFVYHSISLVFMIFGGLLEDISREAQSYLWSFRSMVIFATKIILIICFTKLFLKKNKLGLHERK